MSGGTTTATGYKLRLNQYLTNNNIDGFAVINNRERFLIPSSDNTFGGIKIEYVLIDSGSNSSLLPLPMTLDKKLDINKLTECFPSNQYIWTIGPAHGVGLLPNTTLHIKPLVQNDVLEKKIICTLHSDIKPLEFDLPYLRFSLDKESIETFIESNEILFSEADKSLLQDTLKLLNDIEIHFPSMINMKKRQYCLLGQHFLRTRCSIQLNDTMIFTNKNTLRHKLFPPSNITVNEIVNYLYYQRPSFSKTETFLFCEDDEHGGPDLFNVSQKQIDIDEQ